MHVFCDAHAHKGIYLIDTIFSLVYKYAEMQEVEHIQDRWGTSVTTGAAGFTAVPSVLIRYQSTIKLSSIELVVLLNLITHWWRADELPFVRPTTIANRMGVDRRTVERALRSLEARDLIRRLPGERRKGKLTIRRFDLAGLVSTLTSIADEHRAHFGQEGVQ